MRGRLQSWPAGCCILYSPACGLSTGDQKPRGTGLGLLENFSLWSKGGLRNLGLSSCFKNISLVKISLSFAPVHEQV